MTQAATRESTDILAQAREQVLDTKRTGCPSHIPVTVAVRPPTTITMHSTPGWMRSSPCAANSRHAAAREGSVPPVGSQVSVHRRVTPGPCPGEPLPCGR